jgi:hypothetical protein
MGEVLDADIVLALGTPHYAVTAVDRGNTSGVGNLLVIRANLLLKKKFPAKLDIAMVHGITIRIRNVFVFIRTVSDRA